MIGAEAANGVASGAANGAARGAAKWAANGAAIGAATGEAIAWLTVCELNDDAYGVIIPPKAIDANIDKTTKIWNYFKYPNKNLIEISHKLTLIFLSLNQ